MNDDIQNGSVLGDALLNFNSTHQTDEKLGVITVTQDPGGCGFYRIHQPYRQLRAKFDVNWSDNVLTDDFNTHVVVIQRDVSWDMLGFVKHVQANRDFFPRFVYELDDDILSVQEDNDFFEHYQDESKRSRWIEMMKIADAVTVSTNHLAEQVRKHTEAPVFVLPNRVPLRLFGLSTVRPVPSNGGLKLLWTGSPTHKKDFEHLVPGVTKYLQRYPDAELHFIGHEYSEMFPKNLKKRMAYHGWVSDVPGFHKLYAAVGADMDVVLAPLDDNVFTRSKSNLRLLEAGALGIPVVSSGVGPYSGDTPGALQVHDDKWLDALVDLTKNQEKLVALSEGGKAWVRDNYSAPDGATQYYQTLELIRNPKTS